MASNGAAAEELCLKCGLCCNGVIFADVKLQSSEGARVQTALTGVLPEAADRVPLAGARKLGQPCLAFDGCRCAIYADRPKYCREFECLVLGNLKARRLSATAATRLIDDAKERVARVRALLATLGDTDTHLALAARFRRTRDRLEQVGLDDETADTYGELTLAVHDLNFLLAQSFYP